MILGGKKKEYTDEEKEALWESYIEDPSDVKVYEKLMEAYLPLVEVIAAKTKSTLPAQIEIGDLVSEGFLGLVDAISKFDPSRGWKFETYASNRIRGEITDYLRDYDWVSRYSRLKFKSIAQTEEFLIEELQRQPSEKEIADRLGWTLDELSKNREMFNNSYIMNIDEYQSDSTHEMFSIAEMIADETLGDPEFQIIIDDLGSELKKALLTLPKHKSVVLVLHQFEDRSFEDIAEMFGSKPKLVKSLYFEAVKDLQNAMGIR